MKALTIKQPWASLIVHGIKDIENRTWPCPKKYIGQRVLIHSSAIPVEMINPNSVFTRQQWDSFSLGFQREIICGEGYINSAIIGSVEIIDCVINHPSIWAEKGVYNWLLANPILFPEPIPAKGKLSLWEYDKIQEPVSDGDHNVCMCHICVDEKTQVMSMGDYFVCRYCGGRWYK